MNADLADGRGSTKTRLRELSRPVKVLAIALAILLIPVLLLLLIALLVLWFLYGLLLQATIWLTWLPCGRDTLVVYSDSPHWKDYFENQLLPVIQDRSLLLNWSERKLWTRFALRVLAFQYFGGSRQFNPLIVVFRPFRWAKTFRLWQAFQDNKHGKPKELVSLLDQLSEELKVPERSFTP